MNKLLTLLFILSLPFSFFAQNDIYSLENSKRYADFLFRSMDYSNAAKEYERIIFLDTADFNAKLNLIKSYNRVGDFSKARFKINELFPKLKLMPVDIAREYSIILIRQQNLDAAGAFLSQYKSFTESDKALFSLSIELYRKNWEAARQIAEESKDVDDMSFLQLSAIANQSIDIKYKSPLLSSGLSVLIPGLGKVYSGYWKDGLFSLLFTGIAAWQSYRGFNKQGFNSAYGWIYGGIALGFYSGNIYGSYKAANKYNDTINHSIYHQLEEVYNNID